MYDTIANPGLLPAVQSNTMCLVNCINQLTAGIRIHHIDIVSVHPAISGLFAQANPPCALRHFKDCYACALPFAFLAAISALMPGNFFSRSNFSEQINIIAYINAGA